MATLPSFIYLFARNQHFKILSRTAGNGLCGRLIPHGLRTLCIHDLYWDPYIGILILGIGICTRIPRQVALASVSKCQDSAWRRATLANNQQPMFVASMANHHILAFHLDLSRCCFGLKPMANQYPCSNMLFRQ